jgi:hypothetical protein
MKILCAITLMALMALSALAQDGRVTFGNNSGTPIRSMYGTNMSARVALYGTTQTNLPQYSLLNPLLFQLGATTDTFTPGLFSGGSRAIGNPGDLVTLQIRAWTGGFTTFDLAYAASLVDPTVCVECSARWVQPVGGGTLPTQPITGPGRFQGMTFAWGCVVPEPSSVALACLGLALAAFHIRRR